MMTLARLHKNAAKGEIDNLLAMHADDAHCLFYFGGMEKGMDGPCSEQTEEGFKKLAIGGSSFDSIWEYMTVTHNGMVFRF
jgi:hypothetical protein